MITPVSTYPNPWNPNPMKNCVKFTLLYPNPRRLYEC